MYLIDLQVKTRTSLTNKQVYNRKIEDHKLKYHFAKKCIDNYKVIRRAEIQCLIKKKKK